MGRGYQYGFFVNRGAMYDVSGRERKAQTMVDVLSDFLVSDIKDLRLLNVGGSAGIIDNYLANNFGSVIGVDIDENAIRHAQKSYQKDNLQFLVGDALNMQFEDNSFDVVVCSNVYEHVPDAQKMMDEIFRVLAPGGVCYFAARNRLMWNEPHYHLPLLSLLPRPLAHVYIRLAGKSDYYHELHYSYWGLLKLVERFQLHDYTLPMICDPEKYSISYMLEPGTFKANVARFIAKYFVWLIPSYIWLLQKPAAA